MTKTIAGFKIHIFDEVDTTMETIGEYPADSVVIAKTQTRGRGKGNRKWLCEEGNLYLSLKISANDGGRDYSQLSFITAVAMREAIGILAPSSLEHTTCKWPNDLLFDGKKISGILLEFDPMGGSLVIGIGVNLAFYPKEVAYRATSLAAEGYAIGINELLGEFLKRFRSLQDDWMLNGFSNTRELWMASAHNIGKEINVSVGDLKISGKFDGLDGDGALVLSSKGGITKIHSGDVF